MGNLGRVRTIFTGVPGTPWYSNIYFDANLDAAADYIPFVHDFWTACASKIGVQVTWVVESEVAVIDDATGQIVGIASGTAETGTGTDTTEVLPYSNQGLVNWSTGAYIAGRQLRGKTFIPGLTQTSNQNGSLLPESRTQFEAAALELMADGNGALRIFSPTHLTSEPVVSATVPAIIAVLRSRRD